MIEAEVGIVKCCALLRFDAQKLSYTKISVVNLHSITYHYNFKPNYEHDNSRQFN